MACPSLAGAVAASPRAAMELLDRGTLFSLLPLIIGGGSASASHLIRGPLAWCSLLHDDIGGKGIGEQAERGGADRCGPARRCRRGERTEQSQALHDRNRLALAIDKRVCRQRAAQRREQAPGTESEIAHPADRQHPARD